MLTRPEGEWTKHGAGAPALDVENRPMRKGVHLSRGIWLVLAVALTLVALVACGDDDSDAAEQPTAAAETAPAAAPTMAPEPTAAPTATPEPSAPARLAAECLPGGALEDAATISSCAEQALQQVMGFSFEGEFNLLAVFAGFVPEGEALPAGPEGLIRLSGAIVRPDRLKVEISFGPEGEAIQVAAVVIGEDTYFRDPGTNFWFKGTPPDSDFLSTVQMVGMLQLPRDSGGTLEESVELDDGTTGYVLSYDQSGQQGGMEGMGLPGGNLVLVVGADDFLTREVRVTLEDAGGDAPDIITISYHGYDTPAEIEPPAQYLPLPEGAMEAEPPAEAMVLGLARNADGDVEVTFSEPVHVEGQVELYVIDPATGGWGLPLLGGSGTTVFTFDADAEDRPSLVLGESEIAGFVFPTPDSQMTDADGERLDLTFDIWTYQ